MQSFRQLLSLGVLTLSLGFGGALQAGSANNTLVYASDSEPENISPYHNNVREGVIIARHVWDNLVYRNPQTGKYEPQLATSWKWVDDKTLEMVIREGVKFHNGDVLSAKDVAFTLNYVVDPNSKIITKQNVSWIKSAEQVGNNVVRIHLHEPFPAALEYLSGPVPIYPADYFQKVGLEGFAKAPIGSGPYKITKVALGKGVLMERFEEYWAGSPLGKPAIQKLDFRIVPDSEARLAQLMTGEVDWIWRVSPEQTTALEAMNNLAITSAETMRVGFLEFNPHSDTPLKDVRVRQAINYAINREAIAKHLMKGGSQAIFAPCFREQLGCETSAAKKYEHNPEKAKQLLAEAGFPKGFTVNINVYRDRDIAEAIINDLRKVGIQAKMVFQHYAALRDDYRAGKAPIIFLTWASFSVNDASASLGVYFAGGADDGAKDAEVQKWIQTANTNPDVAVRKENYAKAIKKITEQAYWAPLTSYSTFYAHNKALNFKAYPDELPRFYEASWKK